MQWACGHGFKDCDQFLDIFLVLVKCQSLWADLNSYDCPGSWGGERELPGQYESLYILLPHVLHQAIHQFISIGFIIYGFETKAHIDRAGGADDRTFRKIKAQPADPVV